MTKKIQSNLHYFKISQENPEKFLDKFYIFDEKNPAIGKYIAHIKEIKHLLITIKTLKEKQEKQLIIDKYFYALQEILGDFSNCSEFICFANACDSILSAVKADIDLLKKVSERYFAKRVINEIVPEEWVQAILDTNASRKKGKCGENKLISILKQKGFTEVKTWEDFFGVKNCVTSFSKKFNLKNVRKNLKINIKTKKQNKTLDLIIRADDKIFLLEAKHLNTSGGDQDKQISELIEIISLKERNEIISFISFLDGSYANVILNKKGGSEKLETQRAEIQKHLTHNSRNFWLNTAGFEALFSDLTSE